MKAFLGCSWEVLDLVRSFPAAAGLFMMILWDSLRGPGMKIFVNPLRESLVEILMNL